MLPEDFQEFPKIHRLSREIVITEKLDGTNAQIHISDDGALMDVGSRTRYITPENDNYGFARWAKANETELLKLGPGRHYGEWWGQGIQRGYGLKEKRFSLINTSRWTEWRPDCCHLVPVLYTGPFDTTEIEAALENLAFTGSQAALDFMDPEGVVIFHTGANVAFKKTLKNDEHKGVVDRSQK
jgi:RNA ligase